MGPDDLTQASLDWLADLARIDALTIERDGLAAQLEIEHGLNEGLHAALDVATAEIARLQAIIDGPPPSPVRVGVNSRYYADFVAKVLPVTTQRVYCGTQDCPSGSWWKYAQDFDTAGGTSILTMKRADAAFLERVHDHLAEFANRPTVDYWHEFDEVAASSYVPDARRTSDALRDVATISWCPRAMMFREPPTDPANWYPGDSYIDVIACDGYFKDKHPYGTPETIFGPVLAFARAHAKPFSIFEFGMQSNVSSSNGGPVSSAERAEQMDTFAAYLQGVPELRDLLYWESGPPQVSNDYQFRNDATVIEAFRRLVDAVTGV